MVAAVPDEPASEEDEAEVRLTITVAADED
jgi:hypothetical protein